MVPFRYLILVVTSLLFSTSILVIGQGDDDVRRVPLVDTSARVKQHRAGASGDLVPGEEDLRKILIQWDSIPGAISYEVCHNCDLGEVDDEGVPPSGGNKMHTVGVDMIRAGRPVFIQPGTPLGKNSFHVRANFDDGTKGPWSKERIFNVNEPGNALHEEL